MTSIASAAVLVTLLSSPSLFAQGNSLSSSISVQDDASVRQAIADFVAAFNSRDRGRLEQITTSDMDRRSNQNGKIIVLADARQGTPVMNNPRDDQRWTREIDKVRFITADVALVDTHGDETRSSNTNASTVNHVFNTYVLKKGPDGKWRIAASRY